MEIIIELGRDDKNINPFIEPLGEARRGKWRRANLPAPNLADAEVANLPDLPGYRVAVDENAGTIRVFDPLHNDPHRADIEKALRKFFKRRLEIEPQQLTKDHSKQTLYLWLRWIYRLVDAGNAAVIGPEIPVETINAVKRERRADVSKAGRRDEVES